MRFLLAIILLSLLYAPGLARPFDYNFYLGPEYWLTSSNNATHSAELLTAGFVCRGNLFKLLNAEFRGGVGEISNTKMYFSEVSLLYTFVYDPKVFIGYGLSLLTYYNVLDKSSAATVEDRDLAVKLQYEYSFSPLWSFYLKAMGHNMWGYELGWLGYFDQDFGDFNISLGYKELQLTKESAIKGAFIASNIYF